MAVVVDRARATVAGDRRAVSRAEPVRQFRPPGRVARCIGLPYGDHEILQATFTPLCLGVLLAFALETARSSAIARHPAVRHVVTVLALLLLVVANIPGEFRGWPRVSFQLVAALLVVALVLNPTHWVA